MLIIVRHGEAEPKRDSDRERKLTEEGVNQARRAGKFLKLRGFKASYVATSPYVRAVQTAKEIAGQLGVEVKEWEELEPNRDFRELARKLGEVKEDLVLVGHEPFLSSLIKEMTGGEVKLGTGGVAIVDRREGRWVLVELLSQDTLKLLIP